MAITAKFTADFSTFTSAVEAAETTLTGFQGNAGKVETALNKMVANFSGVKVVQEATLMTEALERMAAEGIQPTADALELAGQKAELAAAKLRALGQDVPPQMQALADSTAHAADSTSLLSSAVGAVTQMFAGYLSLQGIVGAINATITYGKELERTSQQLGISTTAMQELNYAAVATDVPIETLTAAMTQMERKIGEGNAGLISALTDLGLRFEDIRKMSPEDAFTAITTAMSGVTDQMRFAGDAAEIFNSRSGTSIAAVIRQWKDLQQQAKDSNSVIDEDTAKNLADMGRDWDLLWLKAKGYFAFLLANRSNAGTSPGAKALAAPDLGASQTEEAQAQFDAMHEQIPKMIAGLQAPSGFQADTIALQNLNEQTKDGAKNMGVLREEIKVLDDQVNESITANKAAAEAAKKWNDAVDGLQGVLTSSMWDGSIEGALKLGGSVHDLSIYFGTSEGVIRNHKAAMDEWNKVVGIEAPRNLDTLQKELGTMAGAIPQKFFDDGAKVDGTLEKIQSGVELTTSSFGKLGLAAKPAMNDLNATFGTIGLNFDEMEKVSIGGLQHTADIADQTYQFMSDHAEMFTSETIEHFHQLAIAADAAAGDIGAKFTQALTSAEGDIASTLDAALTGGDVGAAGTKLVENFATSLVKGIPIIGDAMSKFVAPIVDGIKKIFGGPSADELAARQTFADFQKQFGTLQQTITAVGAAYAQVGKTGVQAQHDLQVALDATHQSAAAEADALKTINDVMASQQQDQADLTAAVQKYGFTIQELGPAMQKQQLDQQATTLLNDWRLLVGAGIDLSTVNEHMAGSINDYLKLARDTGQEVPEAMEPILQKMIDAGELTDDAGNKITDLKDTGVTFSESMTEGFQKVVDKLTDLINKIPDLAASFANIPGINIPVTYTVTNAPPGVPALPPAHASTGGEVTVSGVQAFAGGGEAGTDTVPAVLTPHEVVLNDSQQKQLLGLAQGGSSAQWREMAGEIRQLREEQAAAQRRLPNQLAAALTSSLLQAKIGRR